MKKKSSLIIFSIVLVVGTVLISEVLSETEAKIENGTSTHLKITGMRPSFWTKTANYLKASTIRGLYKPYGSLTKPQKRFSSDQTNNIQYTTENLPEQTPRRVKSTVRIATEELTTENPNFETTTLGYTEDLEDKILKDESITGLEEFASRLINDTAKFFAPKNGQSRSYPVDEPPQHQLWDDKDQTYHASTFSTAEYEPTPFHHHFIPPPPHHYYTPPKKEDTLLTKVALLALLKLILAKLKAIGFLKIMFIFMMKIPVLFFKFLFILKSFKLLKLITIPLIVASIAAPLLPLLPLLLPLLLAPLLLIPLLLPLLLPLLFFLPIIPVSTPITASTTTNRKRREVTFNAPIQGETGNETRARYMRNRIRPATYENIKNTVEYSGKFNQYVDTEDSPNLIQLTQKLVESQHCIERVACELASQNDSKIYQTAVMWALRKVHNFATPKVKRKIERYADAYETGIKWQKSDICKNKFHCQRPRVLLIQGHARYNVF